MQVFCGIQVHEFTLKVEEERRRAAGDWSKISPCVCVTLLLSLPLRFHSLFLSSLTPHAYNAHALQLSSLPVISHTAERPLNASRSERGPGAPLCAVLKEKLQRRKSRINLRLKDEASCSLTTLYTGGEEMSLSVFLFFVWRSLCYLFIYLIKFFWGGVIQKILIEKWLDWTLF